MKHLSFRLLFCAIVCPPLLYVLSLQGLETIIQKKCRNDLEGILVSDTRSLLQGRIAIQDEIHRNIKRYLASRRFFRWGVSPQIVVRTQKGKWLYPTSAGQTFDLSETETFSTENRTYGPKTMLQVAEQNLNVMKEGIALTVTVHIPRNAWLANIILSIYVFLFTIILYGAYRKSRNSSRLSAQLNQEALTRAHDTLRDLQAQLSQVAEREQIYVDKIHFLKTDLELASDKVRATEDEALVEMEALENKLCESMAIKERLESEVIRLKEELSQIEGPKDVPVRKKRKEITRAEKRFRTLYKNLDIQPRAIEGFLGLQGDLQLRAEELIHNMNQGIDRLPVKRKVFSKKGTETAFECEFAYRGRIYWKPNPEGRTKILAIGTKNSQAKDLTYLQSL